MSFKFYDENGNRMSRLYHGESYRLRAEVLSSHAVLPVPNESNEPQSSVSSMHITPPTTAANYHLFIKNCIIFNANDSDIQFIDGYGCPTIFGIESFQQLEPNIAEAKIDSMFKLPTTNRLHVQCQVELIEGCRFCGDSLCNKNGTRKERLLEQVDMSMLVSTTAFVFEPDQLMSASILGAPISGRSNNSGSKECSEWRFPWLIALSIMLAILLVIMMVINIFLCSSMSCNCFKPETIEAEPNFIEEYDPYKVDYGFYDSRHSLSRHYPLGGVSTAAGNNNPTPTTQFHADSLLGGHSPTSTTSHNMHHHHHHHNVYN